MHRVSSPRALLLFVFLLFFASPLTAQTISGVSVRQALLEGVTEMIAPGAIPGPLVVFGEQTFVIATAPEGKVRVPLIAAAEYGRGRVLAFGHEAFIAQAAQHPGNERLLENGIIWVGQGKPAPQTLRVGTFEPELLSALRCGDADAVLLSDEDKSDLASRLTNLNVLYLNQAALDGKPDAIQAVQTWVRQGGGLIVAGPAWGWKMITGKDLATQHSGNLLCREMGIAWAEGMLSPSEPSGNWRWDDPAADAASAPEALTRLERFVAKPETLSGAEREQATQILTQTIRTLPVDDKRFTPRIIKMWATYGGNMLPTKATPITTAMPFARLKAVLEHQQLVGQPAEKVTAHPAAASFPGSVPAGAKRIKQEIAIDTRSQRWHSPGLYAVPGEVVTLQVPPDVANQGFALRIGAHTDTLWHLDRWERFPEVSRRWEINRPVLRVASPFGGTVFIEVPENALPRTVHMTIEGAIAAPCFVRGKTSPAQWKTLRMLPAPWAELVGEKCALSVPAEVIRTLKNPETVMTYWDEVMRHCADLYGVSYQRSLPERYCVDRQIAAGYMHSGYPIMTHEDVAKAMVDLPLLRGKNGNATWGFYHELGHNYQRPEWTWDGCGEVTNNLFSLYGGEMLNGVQSDYTTTHPAITPEERKKRTDAYQKAGRNYEQWKNDPFLALIMFIELRQRYGWEPFKKVFAEYENLPEIERPKTDQERRDQFMVRFSRAVGKNLGAFFTDWGIPTSEQARQKVATLPEEQKGL